MANELVTAAAQDMYDDPSCSLERMGQLRTDLEAAHTGLRARRPEIAESAVANGVWHAVVAAREHIITGQLIRNILPAYRRGEPLVPPDELLSADELFAYDDSLKDYVREFSAMAGTRTDILMRTLVQIEVAAMWQLEATGPDHPYVKLETAHAGALHARIHAHNNRHRQPRDYSDPKTVEYELRQDNSVISAALLTCDYLSGSNSTVSQMTAAAHFTRKLLRWTLPLHAPFVLSQYEQGLDWGAQLERYGAKYSPEALAGKAAALTAKWEPNCVGLVALQPRGEHREHSEELFELAGEQLGIQMPRGAAGEYNKVALVLGPLGKYVARYTIEQVGLPKALRSTTE